MSADEVALLRLWKEKRGEAEPEDLSDASSPRRPVSSVVPVAAQTSVGLAPQPALAETDAQAATVLIDELDSASFQGSSYNLERCATRSVGAGL